MPRLEAEEGKLAAALDTQLMELPNILDADVPDGADEAENKLLRSVGDIPSFTFTPRGSRRPWRGSGSDGLCHGSKACWGTICGT